MYLKPLLITGFTITFLAGSIDSYAHGGRLNSQGCHNDRKRGTYHCHRSSYTPPPQSYSAPRSGSSSSNRSNINRSSPAHQKALFDSALIMRIQVLLDLADYYNDKADGILGPRTITAIKKYQTEHQLEADGLPSQSLAIHIRNSMTNK